MRVAFTQPQGPAAGPPAGSTRPSLSATQHWRWTSRPCPRSIADWPLAGRLQRVGLRRRKALATARCATAGCLDRQQIVRLVVDDNLAGNLLLAAHRVNTDQAAALDVEDRTAGQGSRDFVGLVRHLHLPQRQAVAGSIGADQMDVPAQAIGRPAHGLAVNRHQAFDGTDDAADPAW